MSEPFLAEIRMVGFDFAPQDFAFCDGQVLPISQNQSLYSLLGTAYGGDGRTDFALPDLRGRAPAHPGSGPGLPNVAQGERGGAEQVALTVPEMPGHNHPVSASAEPASHGSAGNGGDRVLAKRRRFASNVYAAGGSVVALAPESVEDVGQGQAHENRQPYLGINFVIALRGTFPSRN